MLNIALAVTAVWLVALAAWITAIKPQQSCLKPIATLKFDEVFNLSRHDFKLTEGERLAYNGLGLDHECHEYFKETFADASEETESSEVSYGSSLLERRERRPPQLPPPPSPSFPPIHYKLYPGQWCSGVNSRLSIYYDVQEEWCFSYDSCLDGCKERCIQNRECSFFVIGSEAGRANNNSNVASDICRLYSTCPAIARSQFGMAAPLQVNENWDTYAMQPIPSSTGYCSDGPDTHCIAPGGQQSECSRKLCCYDEFGSDDEFENVTIVKDNEYFCVQGCGVFTTHTLQTLGVKCRIGQYGEYGLEYDVLSGNTTTTQHLGVECYSEANDYCRNHTIEPYLPETISTGGILDGYQYFTLNVPASFTLLLEYQTNSTDPRPFGVTTQCAHNISQGPTCHQACVELCNAYAPLCNAFQVTTASLTTYPDSIACRIGRTLGSLVLEASTEYDTYSLLGNFTQTINYIGADTGSNSSKKNGSNINQLL